MSTKVVTLISTLLSICGCMVIFIIHNCWKELRSKSRTILLYITAADFLTAAGYFIILASDGKSDDDGCVVQSFVTTTASMISFFWTCCLALYLHAVAVNSNEELGTNIIRVFHCISWSIPVLITTAAAVARVLGRSCRRSTGEWCWIKICDVDSTNLSNCSKDDVSHAESIIWMLFTGKLWEIISYILIFILYVRIWYHVRKQIKRVSVNVVIPFTLSWLSLVYYWTLLAISPVRWPVRF